MCPHTSICVSSYYYICVLMLLYMCPHTSICVSSYYYIRVSPNITISHTYISHTYMRTHIYPVYACPHTTIFVSRPTSLPRGWVYMCPHIVYVSSCYMCPHTAIYVSFGSTYVSSFHHIYVKLLLLHVPILLVADPTACYLYASLCC